MEDDIRTNNLPAKPQLKFKPIQRDEKGQWTIEVIKDHIKAYDKAVEYWQDEQDFWERQQVANEKFGFYAKHSQQGECSGELWIVFCFSQPVTKEQFKEYLEFFGKTTVGEGPGRKIRVVPCGEWDPANWASTGWIYYKNRNH